MLQDGAELHKQIERLQFDEVTKRSCFQLTVALFSALPPHTDSSRQIIQDLICSDIFTTKCSKRLHLRPCDGLTTCPMCVPHLLWLLEIYSSSPWPRKENRLKKMNGWIHFSAPVAMYSKGYHMEYLSTWKCCPLPFLFVFSVDVCKYLQKQTFIKAMKKKA